MQSPHSMDDLDFGATIKGFSSGQKVFNRYTLQKILGRGGMGVVWLARDGELEREVALKFLPEIVALDPEALGDLKRETRRNLDLTHVHIVRIYDFVTDARAAAISMEYVDGATLSALKIEQPERVLSVAELRPWLEQLCTALHYAHTKAKIVHRDLKPANLMVNRQGDLKITDFGIARGISDSVSRVSKQAGSSGTPIYMSPQQMMGDDPAVSDDIYALGATLFEVLAGKPPFHTGNIVAQVQGKTAPLVNERRAAAGLPPVPPAWEQAIAACLAKVPGDRPASAKELWRRLEGGAVVANAPAVAVPASVTSAPESKPGQPAATRAPVPLFLAAVAAMANAATALLVLGGILWWSERNSEGLSLVANTAWALWSLLAVAVAYGLTAARFSLGRAAGLSVLLAGGAILPQGIYAAVFSDDWVGMPDQVILFAYGLLVVFGTIGGGVLGFLVPGSSWAKRVKMILGGIFAGLLGCYFSWQLVRLGLLPGSDSLLLQAGLAVVLCTLAGLVPWTVSELRTPSARLMHWSCAALSVAAAMVGTFALQAFWHRGMVYYDLGIDWTRITQVTESAVWLLWCLVGFGLFILSAASWAGRKVGLAAGLVFFAAGLLFREKWYLVETSVLQLSDETPYSLADASPTSAILLGVGLMAGGLIARYLEGKPSARQWFLHLAGGVAAGLAGFYAARLAWTPISWEGLQSYQVWHALAGTGLTAFLLWLFLPMLEKRGAPTTGKQ